MNSQFLFVIVLASLALAGCSKKTDAKTELEKAAALMAEPAAAAVPAPPPAPARAEQATQPAPPAPQRQPAQEMNQAIAAYKGGNLDDAVTRLQRLRATPSLTPEQRIALNDAMAAVMTEIYGLAEKGDTRAIQAVKLYEQMQTSR